MRIPYISMLAAGALALGGCAYGGFGYGVGYGSYYGDYGYGAPYYGYGAYDPFGWYGDYYYPGAGVFVFDRNHHRHRWDGDQQRYWSSRRTNWESRSGHHWSGQNWSGFDRHHDSSRQRHDH